MNWVYMQEHEDHPLLWEGFLAGFMDGSEVCTEVAARVEYSHWQICVLDDGTNGVKRVDDPCERVPA